MRLEASRSRSKRCVCSPSQLTYHSKNSNQQYGGKVRNKTKSLAIIYHYYYYYYETASQSLALNERVWCTYVVSRSAAFGGVRTYRRLSSCLRQERRPPPAAGTYDAYGVATAAPAGVARQTTYWPPVPRVYLLALT
jgi:hypothetical protein